MYLCVRYIHTHTKNYLCCIRKVSITSAVFTLENKKKKNTRKQKIKPKSKRRNKDQMENEIIHTLFPI